MSTARPVRILYVEDDPAAALLFKRRLVQDNYEVEIAGDGEEGLRAWVTGSFDVLAVDQDMPRLKGLELLRELSVRGPLPPTVMVTGAGNETIAAEAMKLGADDYIIKDTDARYLNLIPPVIERALEKRRLLEEKKLADEELRESRDRLYRSQEIAHVGSWELDLLTDRLICSDEVYRIFDVAPPEFHDGYEAFLAATHPDDRAAVRSAFYNSLHEDEDRYEIEHRIIRKHTGEVRHVHEKGEHVRDASGMAVRCVGMVQDITERKKAEDQIKASLREKEVLLREIHHRVKNNLAVITSFIRMQSHYATNKTPKEAFEEVQARIRSMALVHEILYQSTNLAYLNVADYSETLLAHLLNSYGHLGTGIIVEKEITEASFGLDTAIPLGILMTEMVSNCFKHAFPHGRRGRIMVSLRSLGDDTFELKVADNGLGMPEGIDLKAPQSMGLDLIDTFVEQLSGEVELIRDNGTEIRIRFREVDKRTWT